MNDSSGPDDVMGQAGQPMLPDANGAHRRTAEDEALRVLIHRPSEIRDRLHSSLFDDPIRREAFEALQSVQPPEPDGDDEPAAVAGAQAEAAPPETRGGTSVVEAVEVASPPAASLLCRLAAEPVECTADDGLAALALRNIPRVMERLRRDVRHFDDPQFRQDCARSLTWLKQQEPQVINPRTRAEALAAVVPWLIEYRSGLVR